MIGSKFASRHRAARMAEIPGIKEPQGSSSGESGAR